ncbi:hypothetical protein [Agromyces sp. Soil535]|uniref:hypothetical protein n=1 Tax=Agromyces sp. Soil535 TaxID=1736390 RepID=UPI0006F21C52|nr:hypothetical protein [Agromyces sp. Soil535]KRE30572.1 hypothetical protein ASG80_17720 [Agromyces sp. Soil535]
MHITIEIDDGEERSRVTLSGTPAAPAASPPASDMGAPLDAGPAPDVFAAGSQVPPGVTDLSGDSSASAGAAPDLS